jgi:pimeloyl-ACP methyl ester carboxylesterase
VAASFDPQVLRASLRPLVPGERAILTPDQDRYLRHYGIHFADSIEGLAHQLGRIETSTHLIAAHLWTPRDPKGSAVVVHGYYDHVGLYGHLIRFLLDRDLAVLSFDLPGHGLSSGEPATIETFDHYVEAFDACINAFESHLPKPWNLFGQSTGGAIAMEWLLANGLRRATSPFEHVVLLAPLVRPANWPVGLSDRAAGHQRAPAGIERQCGQPRVSGVFARARSDAGNDAADPVGHRDGAVDAPV